MKAWAAAGGPVLWGGAKGLLGVGVAGTCYVSPQPGSWGAVLTVLFTAPTWNGSSAAGGGAGGSQESPASSTTRAGGPRLLVQARPSAQPLPPARPGLASLDSMGHERLEGRSGERQGCRLLGQAPLGTGPALGLYLPRGSSGVGVRGCALGMTEEP